MPSRVDDLPLVTPDRLHVFPVMKDGQTGSAAVGAVLDLVLGSTPEVLDTLEKLAEAIGNDPDFAETIATMFGLKLDALQPFFNVASASVVDLGAVESCNIRVTGATTITSFGDALAGTVRTLRFSSALTLVHNATSMILPNGGANILVDPGDSLAAVSLGNGNWYVTNYQKSRFVSKMAVLQDQRGAGINGGNAVVGWQTRALNTEVSDPDNIVTISANTFVTTVDCWLDAECAAFMTNYNMLRVWNVTDNVEVLRGVNQYSGASAPGWSSLPRVQGRITAGKTYRLEMYAAAAAASTGLGTASNAGGPEIYCNVALRALS